MESINALTEVTVADEQAVTVSDSGNSGDAKDIASQKILRKRTSKPKNTQTSEAENEDIMTLEEAEETISTLKAVRYMLKKEQSANKHAYIYLGPNIPGGLLFSGSLYKEVPKHLDGIFKQIPGIKELFIEVKDAPSFKCELARSGSEAARLYQNIVALIEEGALKDGRL